MTIKKPPKMAIDAWFALIFNITADYVTFNMRLADRLSQNATVSLRLG